MTTRPAPVILWFRQDLRLADNPALDHAMRTGRPLIPVYILDDGPAVRRIGAASRWWLEGSLHALAADLGRRGAGLAGRPVESAGPVGRRRTQGPVVEGVAGQAGDGLDGARRRHRRRRRRDIQQRPEEGSEDRYGPPEPVRTAPGRASSAPL